MKALKTDLDLDIEVNSRRIDELVRPVNLLTQHIDKFEQNPIQATMYSTEVGIPLQTGHVVHL